MTGQNPLRLRLLGELEVARESEVLALPQSKKTRALLAYLAAVGRPQRRERLCILLWDIPDDPRGSLRWSLSKLRNLVDAPDHKRIVADRDSVRFDNSQTEIDLHKLRSVAAKGLDHIQTEQLESLAETFRGEFLEGLDLPNCPDFQAWCVAEREETRALNLEILRRLLKAYAGEPENALRHGRRLIQLDPYDETAKLRVVEHLAVVGRWDEAEQHYEAGTKVLKQVGGDHGKALEHLWRRLRTSPPAKTAIQVQTAERPPVGGPAAHNDGARPRDHLGAIEKAAEKLPLPDKPSIVVIPFTQADGGPSDLADFGYGVSEDLATALANTRWSFVISPGSTLRYRGQEDGVEEIAQDLGVRYVATGVVAKSKEAIQLAIEVTDTVVGTPVVSERLETAPHRLSELLGDGAEIISGAIKSEFDDAAVGRARPRAFADLEAWELCKRARLLLLERDGASVSQALDLLQESIKLDPGLSQAYSYRVVAHFAQVALDLVAPEPAWTEAVIELAESAVERDQKDALAHCAVGLSRIVRREHQLAIPALETAVGLNPSLTEGHYALGTAFLCSGRIPDAISHFQQAIRLSPYDPNMGFFLLRMAEAHLLSRDYDKAVEWGRRALERGPAQWTHYSVLVSALGHLDRLGEASTVLAEIGGRWPNYTLAFVRDRHLFTDQIRLEFVGEPQMFTDQDVFAHYLDGLRKSGVSAHA